ncbi:NAD(P)H-dependent oxidoreductase [Bellilinea sp.]|uniref:NAD(P)H-dependent oxidoreductase n=1 Tax=Bellilinea sp. TaxID=2838785 RepID=UPI002ADE5FFF|nr:SAF domain-containing protein [Bellilinea sp.]
MIGLYKDLEDLGASGKSVRIGLIGAGQMGTDVVAQTTMMKGVKVVISADIDINRAKESYRIGRVSDEVVEVFNPAEADAVVQSGKRAVTNDYRIVTDMQNVDVVLEATGVPQVGASAALRAARCGHDLAMMNVETDITVGPILNWYAQKKGVLYALAAGDEPAACKELYDFARALGFTIVAAGKGKNNPLDRYASPTDPSIVQEAKRRGLSPNMLVEFIDGSKTMIEMAAVSNSTGLIPDVRGMHGPHATRDTLNTVFTLKEDGGVLNRIGVVDYGVGPIAPGVFVIVRTDHPRLREAMVLRDMGNGPYYTLFRPYHLCSIEVPLTCALLTLRRQSNMMPQKVLVSEVFAVAKRDLAAGDVLDGIGGVSYYSLIDTYQRARAESLLPIGLAKGARVVRPISKDHPITYQDVEVKPTMIYKLRQLQDTWFDGKISDNELLLALDQLANQYGD